jgi:hypothetical protein
MLLHLPLGDRLYSPKVFITSESWVCIVFMNTTTIQFKGNWKHLVERLKTEFSKMSIFLALYCYGKAAVRFLLHFTSRHVTSK